MAENAEWRRWVALGALATAQLMIAIDALIMLIALPVLQTDLGIAQADGQWVVTIYALPFGALLLLGGRVGDYNGRKRAFLIGWGGFIVAPPSVARRRTPPRCSPRGRSRERSLRCSSPRRSRRSASRSPRQRNGRARSRSTGRSRGSVSPSA